jgi:hypothetical protein
MTTLRRCLALTLLALLLATPSAWAGADRKTGSITTNGDIVALQALNSTMGALQITGTWTGTIQFEATLDGSTWVSVAGTPAGGGAAVTSTTANGAWTFAGAFALVRLRASAAMTGTAVTTLLVLIP